MSKPQYHLIEMSCTITSVHIMQLIVAYSKVKADDVNGDDSSSGIVLQCSSEEGLWEKEARDPEDGRNSIVDPLLYKLHSLHQVQHPCSQRLQRGVGLRMGSIRHLGIAVSVNYMNMYTFASQSFGTVLLYMLLNIVSRPSDITTKPFRAFSRSRRVEWTSLSRRL